MKLLVLTHVRHYTKGGRLHAYGPYAREIDLWAGMFDRVTIAAPLASWAPPGDCARLQAGNLSVEAMPELNTTTLPGLLRTLAALPWVVLRLAAAMAAADAVHIRCPGNYGLLGAVLAPIFCRRRYAKYAGQWNFTDAKWTVRLERRILRSNWWKGPVTVYGEWPGEPPHIIPFFTSMLSAPQLERGRAAWLRRNFAPGPLHAIYTGRLSKAKNVDAILRAIAAARARGIAVRCTVVGDGPELGSLRRLAAGLEINPLVQFTGGVSYDRVLDGLAAADVLVLISETEGWPKSIAEGMAFGLVCIGSDQGLTPRMLSEGRGIILPPGDPDRLADALCELALDPERRRAIAAAAIAWSSRYSIEGLAESLKELLERWWKVKLNAGELTLTKEAAG
ncbi:MAG: glycosyltransferase [Bryobacteraceae bacterium]